MLEKDIMKQLSVIYLIIFSVLVVGFILIILSPQTAQGIHRSDFMQYNLLFDQSQKKDFQGSTLGEPIYFIPNRGAIDEQAEFYARTSHFLLVINQYGLSFKKLLGTEKKKNEEIDHSMTFQLVFLNSNEGSIIVPLFKTKQSGFSSSKGLLYKEIYNNIDLKISGDHYKIALTWIVKPGGNPSDISFQYKNARTIRFDDHWNLAIGTNYGEMIYEKPKAYQVNKGKRINVPSHFEALNRNIYGFKIKAYDRDNVLVIDPVVCGIF